MMESSSATGRLLREPQQRRSQEAYERIIAAARGLAEQRDFDAIAIRDLAKAAGCSIGSFYYRFGNKEEFFRTLTADMIERREAEAEETFAKTPLEDLPAALARGALVNFRRYAGFLRSLIKRHLQGEPAWEPISLMGRRVTLRYIARLEEERGRPLTALQKERISFSFVWLYGLLAQSLIGLNTIFTVEARFFEQEAIKAFERAIAEALAAE